MNDAQLNAMRTIGEVDSVYAGKRRQPITAKEMAVRPHNLSRDGMMAVETNGDKWVWDRRFNQWSPF